MISVTGRRIKELRTEKGITQSELAEMLDKTCSAPRMWELGKSMPDAATIKKLAAYFECSSDYLLDISDFKTEKDKIAFINIEKNFFDKLGRMRDRDKICLVNALNNYIGVYNEVECETGLGYEQLSSLLEAVTEMFAEIKNAAVRRANKLNDEDPSENNCEQNVLGITHLGKQKLKADESLDLLCGKLLSAYLRTINGVLCCNNESEEEREQE